MNCITAAHGLFWIGALIAFAVLHLAFFLPDPIPGLLLWVPAKLSRLVSRGVLHDPGTHGFGYLNPRLLMTFAYIFAIAVSVAVGGVAQHVRKSMR